VEQDAWAPDTPIRVLLKQDQADLAAAREKAAGQAAPILQKLALKHPGHLLASNPPAEMGADPHRVTVNPRYELRGAFEPQTFQLSDLPLPAPEICKGLIDEPMLGFRLQSQKSGAAPVTLHQDTSIPESRGCPLGYAISDIIAFRRPDQREVLAVLISVSQFGFEGPDRRFLAVTRAPE
jgi:predicted secreted protein